MAYKAFVSSTFEDLKEYRKVVIASLRKAGIFVDPMEDWTASSEVPKIFSQDRLKDCDLCVLLVGFRRGHIPEGEELSITQLEYQAAENLQIDVLVFMLQEDTPWPSIFDEREKDPGIRQFRAQLEEYKIVSFFGHDPGSIEIAPALTRWIGEKRRPKEPVSRFSQVIEAMNAFMNSPEALDRLGRERRVRLAGFFEAISEVLQQFVDDTRAGKHSKGPCQRLKKHAEAIRELSAPTLPGDKVEELVGQLAALCENWQKIAPPGMAGVQEYDAYLEELEKGAGAFSGEADVLKAK